MLTIWGRLNSHNVKKIVWFADELSLPYVRYDAGGEFGMDAEYRNKNPNALIPTIEDGDLILWESNAILRYLANRHAPEPMWPNDPAKRALGDRWMDWQFAFADAQRGAFFNLIRRNEGNRDIDAVTRSAKACGNLMAILDAQLSKQPWLSGENFGVADVPMGVYAHTFFTLDIIRAEFPHARAWYNKLTERAAYAKSVMIPLT